MQEMILETKTQECAFLRAIFLPEKGMTLTSYTINQIEIIDQSTKKEFEERRSGLGVLIGPHFHRRNPHILPLLDHPERFPHIEYLKAKGSEDPFSHGVGRYAPWKCEQKGTSFKAYLSGEDSFNGSLLKDLEGQNFKMYFSGELTPLGLSLKLSITSDTSSIIGIHYYYRLPENQGQIEAFIQNKTIENGRLQSLDKKLHFTEKHLFTSSLDQDFDQTLYPFPDPLEGKILLKTKEYQLLTHYTAPSEESSWQIYHPKNASFVCIEPVSAQNPRRTNLTTSSIAINLQPFIL